MEKIYEKPLFGVIEEINSSKNDTILLAGNRGTGKTTVINEYLKDNGSNLRVNCNYNIEELLKIEDKNIFKLYHVCLLINKILNYLFSKNEVYKEYFNDFLYNIKLIIFNIKNMYVAGNYDNKLEMFGPLVDEPEILLDSFVNRLSKLMDVNTMKIVIDDFDSVMESSALFQKTIYNLLKNRLNSLLVISAREVIKSEDRRKELKANNDFIMINYSFDIATVREILDKLLVNEMNRIGRVDLGKRVRFILDDELIKTLIELTKGNIVEMYNCVLSLYYNINTIPRGFYQEYIINYFNDRKELFEINGVYRERKLHI